MSYTRRETRGIWKHFTKTFDSSSFAVCKFCNVHISRGGKNASIKGFKKKTDDTSESSCGIGPPPKKQATVPQLFESGRKYAVDDPQ